MHWSADDDAMTRFFSGAATVVLQIIDSTTWRVLLFTFCLLCTTRGSVSEMANRGCAILLSRYSRFDQVPEDYS